MKAGARGHGGTGARLGRMLSVPLCLRASVPLAAQRMLSVPLCLWASVPLAAQELPSVRAAVQLAADGRGDSARILVNVELARHRAGSGPWVEVLFWRGRLAGSGDSAERDLRRVAIEYASSPWADDALLHLAQLALAAGNAAGAYDLAGRLRADYPGSELRSRAALWKGRAAFLTGETRAACALLDSARTEAGADVEFVNQVEFYRGRCAAISAAPPPTPAAAPPDTTAADPRVSFEVQVAAARSEAAARAVADRLTRAGQRARIVAGEDGLRRVRLGPFATREEADQAAQAARRIAGGTPFVVRLP